MITIDYSKALASQKFDYPYVFYDNVGTDQHLLSYIKIIKNWDYKDLHKIRNVNIKLTSFRNVTDNAKHYYGSFIIDGVSLFDTSQNKFVRQNNPLYQPQYNLRLYHPLTHEDMEEKDINGNYRYNSLWYKEGDYVESFNSIKDIIDLSINVIKERFKGNWNFYLLSLDCDKNLIAEMNNDNLIVKNLLQYE